MPLARIISRSHACSRELALELLARGYAVEIVSPDKLPDSMADLELRVDEGPGDHLFAKVEAHDGQRSASLDFVHHLKTPMGDFIRRPIQPSEGIANSRGNVQAVPIAEPVIEPLKLTPKTAAVTAPAPSVSGGAVEAVKHSHSKPLQDEPPPDNSPPVKPSSRPVIASPVVLPASMELPKVPLPRLNGGRAWRAALAVGCIFLLAFTLWFGIRHRGTVTANASKAAAVKKVADAPAQSLSATEKTGIPNYSARVNLAKPSRRSDDYVAPNTIVYLNKPAAEEALAKAKAAKRSARSRAVSRGVGDGVVAANSVIYLSNKPARQTPKSDSGKLATAPN